MAALATVQDIVSEARILLQDTVAPYRYADTEFVIGLNMAMLEARRLRPDLFINTSIPSYSAVDSTAVSFEDQYRTALVYYICGNAQLRDEENTEDARAAMFMTKFVGQLTMVPS